METSGTEILNDSDVRAPISPLHLAVSDAALFVPARWCRRRSRELISALTSTRVAFVCEGLSRAPPRPGGPGAVAGGFRREEQPRANPAGPGRLQGPCGVRGRPDQPGSLHPGQGLHPEAHPDSCCSH